MLKQRSSWLTGLALFAMFFGAGNVTFPLLVGQYAAQNYGMSMLGLLLSAVCVPIVCLLSMIMYNADYRAFFCRLGRWPGWTLILLGVLLLGPFMVLPRVITVAHGAVTYELLDIPLVWFSLIFCVLTGLLTIKNSILTYALGYVLTPLLLFFCVSLIAIGLWAPPLAPNVQVEANNYFLYGLLEGYFTLDAVAALFFAGILLKSITNMLAKNKRSPQRILKTAFVSSIIGGLLLGLVYLGLAGVSAKHGYFLFQEDVGAQQVLTALSYHLLPTELGVISAAIVLLACLTTALAVTALFADFLHDTAKSFKFKFSYVYALLLTLAIALGMSSLGFDGLMGWLGPVVVFFYPIFIVLSVCNLMHKLTRFHAVKVPVFLTLCVVLVTYAV